jgi:choline dehydrogenase
MGTGDDNVVTPEPMVHGLGNLRIADTSVMPELTSGNINAAA